ncbi:hypothetical protein GCM10025868_05650 [Angustibacter aerolatus]|uniref:Uncharacterized protein n=1 Tax=Angustibacter aerolatus TaxID=1162965 RepID=A0ABQ6JER7_9ACTN|nr:hypothetical protein GCM10025868_05650 [Angustibacter aerolatus]
MAVPSEATAAQFREALDAAFADPDVDSVVAGFMPPLLTLDREVAESLAQVAAAHDKPCVASFLGMRGLTQALSSATRTVPAYPTPEDAVRALVSAVRYGEWVARDRGGLARADGVLPDVGRELVQRLLPDDPDGVWLAPAQTREPAGGVRHRGVARAWRSARPTRRPRRGAVRVPGGAEGDRRAPAAPRRPGRGAARHRRRGRACAPTSRGCATCWAPSTARSPCRRWRRPASRA